MTRSSRTARETARASSRRSGISRTPRGRSAPSRSSPRRSRPTRRFASATGSRTPSAPARSRITTATSVRPSRTATAVCWSGYYHGILERAFAGVSEEELPAVSRRLCSSDQVRRSDFVAYQCVHGLGHGLMIYTNYDMPLVARDVRRALDRLGPDFVHWRRVHGEPPDVVRNALEVAARRRPALSLPDRRGAAQALLLSDGHLAHPRRRRRGLAADRRLVPQGGGGLGGDVLPVARAGCLRPDAPGSAGDHPHLLARAGT